MAACCILQATLTDLHKGGFGFGFPTPTKKQETPP